MNNQPFSVSDAVYTLEWWNNLLKDDGKLIRWLKKLYWTELDGGSDHIVYMNRYNPDDRTRKILTNISEDEFKHAKLISDLLESRGHAVDSTAPKSSYWGEMNSNIVDIGTAVAVNYFGEQLAAFRFEVLIASKNTPSDIRELLGIVLPDEQFHRETLGRLALSKIGEEKMHFMRARHLEAMNNLRGNK